MSEIDIKRAILAALKRFSSGNLADNAQSLFETLGYQTDKSLRLESPTSQAFVSSFASGKSFNLANALLNNWRFVDLLFQLTKDEITGSHQIRINFDNTSRIDNTIIESYLFFAVELVGDSYTRTQLAGITREVNKLFPMPVMLLFKYGSTLNLSIINRRLHKRDESKDILERKITLIKDIDFTNPHPAHVAILIDLSLEKLARKHKFTNFVQLHKAWQATLSTKKLNDDFFRDIADWYFWARQQVVFPADAPKDEDGFDSVSLIRLITRLIFIWFLKEKRQTNQALVPDELFQIEELRRLIDHFEDSDSSSYYKAILQNLFFATLNQEMNIPEKPENRKFRHEGKGGQRDHHYMVHNVYRYKSLFKQPDKALKLFDEVPFLNGGLFECLDHEDPSNSKRIVRIDGFSDRPDNILSVPNRLFFGGSGHSVDLSESYGNKMKPRPVSGLIDILNAYKFTIAENTPIEEEIALDPELLGKVFENLLAAYNPETKATARKQTGSFYTPREVVDYMVDESLLVYLATQMVESGLVDEADRAGLEERLQHLLDYNSDLHQFDHPEVIVLIDAIDRLKILDPAVGSGAFPMGILQKLVFILSKLDPNNKLWEHQQKEREILAAMQDMDIALQINYDEAREAAIQKIKKQLDEIESNFTNNEKDYPRKLFLIENCIYGVDIQPIAVQIAKLRFFISLIVEQGVNETLPNRGILPLPNLETKFIAANTLVELNRSGQLMIPDPRIEKKKEDLKRVRHEIFKARTPKTKQKYRNQDRELRTEISKLLKTHGWSDNAATQLVQWDPYDQNQWADFFDPEWMFQVRNGFDVIIGNPPYIRIQELKQSMPDKVSYFKDRYESAKKGNYDLYVVFVERGIELLNSKGNFAFILPHKFFNAQYGEGLRGLLAKGKHLRKIVHFGEHQVFTSATTYVCLLFLNKFSTKALTFIKIDSPEKWISEGSSQKEIIPISKISSKEWNFTLGEATFLVDRLNSIKTKLENVSDRIFQGLKTSADKVYILEKIQERDNQILVYSRQTDREYWLEPDLLHPLIKGGDSKAYWIGPTNLLILFPYAKQKNGNVALIPSKLFECEYPLSWNYLLENKEFLEQREKGKMRTDKWYGYIYPKALDVMALPKLFTPDIALSSSFSFDIDGDLFFTGGVSGGYGIKVSSDYSPYYLLGLLNSRLLEWLLQQSSTQMRGGYYSYESRFIKNLPIRKIESPTKENTFISIVRYILFAKKKVGVDSASMESSSPYDQVMVNYFEQIIDALVYELYLPEDLRAHNFAFASPLQSENLPVLDNIQGDKLKALRIIFKRLYAQDHPLRRNLFLLDTIPVIRMVEGKV